MSEDIHGLARAVMKQNDLSIAQYQGGARDGELVVDTNPGPGQYQIWIGTLDGTLIPASSGGGGGNAPYANTAGYANDAGTANFANFAGNANYANFSGQVTQAAQPNITSVGTLTSLSVGGNTVTSALTANGNVTAANLVSDRWVSNSGPLTLESTGGQDITLNPAGNINASGKSITNLPLLPTNPGDATSKNYVDSVAQGLRPKAPVQAVSDTNINLAAPPVNIDGVPLVAGMRVLVRGQTTQADNGIYEYDGAVLNRSSDASTSTDFPNGTFVFSEDGLTYGKTGWALTTGVTTLGTDPIVFQQISSAGNYTNGTGLSLVGPVFSISNTTVTSGSYGNGDSVPQITVNPQGQLTNVVNVPVTANAANLIGDTLSPTVLYSSLKTFGTIDSLTVAGPVNLGSVANLTLGGGANGQVLSTDGAGNLSWVSGASGAVTNVATSTTDNSGLGFTLTGGPITTTGTVTLTTPSVANIRTGLNLGNVANLNLDGNVANVLKGDGTWGAAGGGGGGTPAAPVNSVQFNNAGAFGGSSALTWDGTTLQTTDLLVSGNVRSSLLPNANVTYDLGSSTQRWKDIWLANSTIYLGNVTLSSNGSRLTSNASGIAVGTDAVASGDGSFAFGAGAFANRANSIAIGAGANASFANNLIAIGGTTSNVLLNGTVYMPEASKVKIPGATANGQVLTVANYQTGDLAWANAGGGGSSDGISNGSSNMRIPQSGGNIQFNVPIVNAANANLAQIRITKPSGRFAAIGDYGGGVDSPTEHWVAVAESGGAKGTFLYSRQMAFRGVNMNFNITDDPANPTASQAELFTTSSNVPYMATQPTHIATKAYVDSLTTAGTSTINPNNPAPTTYGSDANIGNIRFDSKALYVANGNAASGTPDVWMPFLPTYGDNIGAGGTLTASGFTFGINFVDQLTLQASPTMTVTGSTTTIQGTTSTIQSWQNLNIGTTTVVSLAMSTLGSSCRMIFAKQNDANSSDMYEINAIMSSDGSSGPPKRWMISLRRLTAFA